MATCSNTTLSIEPQTGQLLQTKDISGYNIIGADTDGGTGCVSYHIRTSGSAVKNCRYPHSALITRAISSDDYDPFNPTPTANIEVYHGECRNYKNNKTATTNGVMQSDYAVSLPYTTIDIMAGDKIVVTERARTIEGVVDDAYLGNLGMTVFWSKVNN